VRSGTAGISKVGLNGNAGYAVCFGELFAESLGGLGRGVGGIYEQERTALGGEISSDGRADTWRRLEGILRG
jgi:hypothetical protein